MVRKAYLIDVDPFNRGLVRRVLVSDGGMVFIPGHGWTTLGEHYKLKVFPQQFEGTNWPHNGWWTSNWKNPTWAWCYSRKRVPFTYCYRSQDGALFAA